MMNKYSDQDQEHLEGEIQKEAELAKQPLTKEANEASRLRQADLKQDLEQLKTGRQ